MSQLLQYNYAAIDVSSGKCVGVITTSSEINHEAYVLVPEYTDDYKGKYYNQADGLWYLDADFNTIWTDAPTW
jgi:hypothetical protein